MIVLGLVLLVVGWLVGIPLLTTLGIIVLVAGLVLWALGSMGRPVGGRRWYY
ncbi:DUF6131 family protein [Nocardia sp. NBC_01503]|uniref:DUF6131 family protein n=1 Tax=Nocardia sp. NBC_01503 TaxID=2975997 RepID=UPI002E7C095E|nr:DUF6131 family protein [Nocardia sp. NBC_01503]WTL31915.1 DUF6131 family protein [Nocardia sp. NBC_01503]